MLEGKAVKGEIYWTYCGFRKERFKVFCIRGGKEFPRVARIWNEDTFAEQSDERRFHKYGCPGLLMTHTVYIHELFHSEEDMDKRKVIKLYPRAV